MTTSLTAMHMVGCNCPLCTGQAITTANSSTATQGGLTLTTQDLAVPGATAGYIQSLIGTNAYKWVDAGPGHAAFGVAATVLYTFGTTSWSNPYGYAGSTVFDASRTAAAMAAMQDWSNVANVNFVQGTTSTAHLAFRTEDLPAGVAGQTATWVYNDGSTIAQSEVAMDVSQGGYSAGQYGFMAVMHEIGHAIGLKHPGNYNAGGGGASGPYLTDYGLTDSHDFSVMSYYAGHYSWDENNGNPITPMLYDIAAAQQLYGANHNYNSGDTTYTLTSTSGIFARWDGAGNDTLNSSGYTGNVTLDLREGASYVTNVGNSHSWNAFGANIENATAGSGNDTLYGNALANILMGGDGNDMLWGFGGNDTLMGGNGTDTYQFNGNGDGTNTIVDSDGQGSIVIDGITVAGTAGVVSGSNYSVICSSVMFDLSLSGSTLSLLRDGCSTIALISNFYNGEFGIDLGNMPFVHLINGNAVANTLTGTAGDDLIYGYGGNDNLSGGTDGSDTIWGGTGNDIITTQGVNSSLYGEDGSDTLIAGGAGSTLDGGAGNDTITANGINAIILGGAGVDRITVNATGANIGGGDDNDIITANVGADNAIIDGGNGADTIIVNAAGATVTGGAGIDRITINGANATVTTGDDGDIVTLGAGAADANVTFGTGNDTVTSSVTSGTSVTINTLGGNDKINAVASTVSNIIDAGDGNDIITGGRGADTIYGGNGNDIIVINGAGSTVDGGAGIDKITVNAANATVTAGDDADTVILGAAATNASVSLGNGNDIISIFITSAGNTTVHGDAGDDRISAATSTVGLTLYGDDGNDTIIGGSGADLIYGGNGDDRITGGLGDTIWGGSGNDIITISGAATVYGEDGDDRITGSSGNDTIDGGNGNNVIVAGAGDDTIITGSGNDNINGGAGNDIIHAGAGDDIIIGGGGNDTIYGEDGNDTITVTAASTIYGGNGNDTITGSSGNDTIDGGDGNNIIVAGAGNDTIITGSGNDNINGGAGNDIIHAGAGDDSIIGGGGNDTIYGEDGNDTITVTGASTIYGGDGNDTITGSTGSDTIDGGAGNNILIGAAGSDTIIGGSGSNTIYGGTGADTIQLAANNTADYIHMAALNEGAVKGTVTGYDAITGFESGTDHFQFGPALKTAWDDVIVNNAMTFAVDTAVNFNSVHEAWIVTGFADADLTQAGWTNLLAGLNAKGITASAGADGLIVAEGANETAVFGYTESSTANRIAASELTLLAVVNGHLAASDFGFYS